MPLTQVQTGLLQATGTPSASTFLRGDGVWAGQTVVQIVKNNTAGAVTSTSTSFIDVTNFTVTITPTSASNRILIMTSSNLGYSLVGGTNVNAFQQVVRNATALSQLQVSAESGSGGIQACMPTSFALIDSPATTSATTYKVQQRVSTASSTGFTISGHIIVMEILG
jgi:hypothetical protein